MPGDGADVGNIQRDRPAQLALYGQVEGACRAGSELGIHSVGGFKIAVDQILRLDIAGVWNVDRSVTWDSGIQLVRPDLRRRWRDAPGPVRIRSLSREWIVLGQEVFAAVVLRREEDTAAATDHCLWVDDVRKAQAWRVVVLPRLDDAWRNPAATSEHNVAAGKIVIGHVVVGLGPGILILEAQAEI